MVELVEQREGVGRVVGARQRQREHRPVRARLERTTRHTQVDEPGQREAGHRIAQRRPFEVSA